MQSLNLPLQTEGQLGAIWQEMATYKFDVRKLGRWSALQNTSFNVKILKEHCHRWPKKWKSKEKNLERTQISVKILKKLWGDRDHKYIWEKKL